MRYALTLNMNPEVWETLTEDQHHEVFRGHQDFLKLVSETGEMVHTKALGDPAGARTVRVRDGATSVEPGLLAATEAFLCGYYVVDVESEERAVTLAALIPDAKYTAVEVREVVFETGPLT